MFIFLLFLIPILGYIIYLIRTYDLYHLNSFIKGFRHAWKIPTLPEPIIKIILHSLFRIFRVISGISLIILVSQFFLILFLILNVYFITTNIFPVFVKKISVLNDIKNKMQSYLLSVYYNLYNYITSNYKFAFIIPFIFQKLGTEVSSEAEPFIQFALSIGLLNTLVLLSFLNIMFYVGSIYLISKYESTIRTKYPRLIKLLHYYSKINVIFIIVETILTIVILLLIIVINVYVCKSFIFK